MSRNFLMILLFCLAATAALADDVCSARIDVEVDPSFVVNVCIDGDYATTLNTTELLPIVVVANIPWSAVAEIDPDGPELDWRLRVNPNGGNGPIGNYVTAPDEVVAVNGMPETVTFGCLGYGESLWTLLVTGEVNAFGHAPAGTHGCTVSVTFTH